MSRRHVEEGRLDLCRLDQRTANVRVHRRVPADVLVHEVNSHDAVRRQFDHNDAVKTGARKELRRQRWQRLRHPAWLGTLRRTRPLSYHWGAERGTPIDRYFIERFLTEHRGDIRGRVLEVMDDRYTRRFGDGVERSDVLDIDAANGRATIHADLGAPNSLPTAEFDCFVLTQTLQFIPDLESALGSARDALREGGVLLATLPVVSKIDRGAGVAGDYWRFTVASATRAFAAAFGQDRIQVTSFGNVLVSVAFLMGMAVEDLKQRELDFVDEYFPLLVAVRAVRA